MQHGSQHAADVYRASACAEFLVIITVSVDIQLISWRTLSTTLVTTTLDC